MSEFEPEGGEVQFGPDDYTEGYRAGFVKGYEDGIADGRGQGWRDAKHLAYRAVRNDLEATERIEAMLGEL